MLDGVHFIRPSRCVKAVGGIAAAVLALLLSCERLPYPLRPFVHSTVPLEGVVRDSLSDAAIVFATVRIGGNGGAVTTDERGAFRLDGMPTGAAEIEVSAAGYRKLTMAMDITLDPAELTCRLARTDAPPVVETVVIDSGGLRYFDDPVTIAFRTVDSSGGIAAAVLFTGDTGAAARMELRPPLPEYAMADSFTVHYPAPGVWNARLEIVGARGDTSRDSFVISTQRPKRPAFLRLRAQSRFLSGEPGYLEIATDGNFTRLSIDWGDGSAPENFYGPQGPYWHTYVSGGDAQFDIAVTLFDGAGEVNDTTITATISELYPPLLDGRLYFEPSQYLAPHDTAILIGVRVLDIEGWVRQIIWIVNEHAAPSAFAYALDTLGEIRGALPAGSAALFVHRFPTAGFTGVNDVRIIVVDQYNNAGTVSGSFYIAGRPGG